MISQMLTRKVACFYSGYVIFVLAKRQARIAYKYSNQLTFSLDCSCVASSWIYSGRISYERLFWNQLLAKREKKEKNNQAKWERTENDSPTEKWNSEGKNFPYRGV